MPRTPEAATLEVEHLRVAVTRPTDGAERGPDLTLELDIEPGWKLFGAGSADGLPISVHAEDDRAVTAEIPTGTLTGRARVEVATGPDGTPAALQLRYQLCSGAVCQRPRTLRIPLAEAD